MCFSHKHIYSICCFLFCFFKKTSRVRSFHIFCPTVKIQNVMTCINITHKKKKSHCSVSNVWSRWLLHMAWTPVGIVWREPSNVKVRIRQQLSHKLLRLTAWELEKHILISSRVNTPWTETFEAFLFHSTYVNFGEFNASQWLQEEAGRMWGKVLWRIFFVAWWITSLSWEEEQGKTYSSSSRISLCRVVIRPKHV